ncbi:signal recognition particle receptor subunit beta [Trichomonascus vanleenenianus]|uniref:Signal recognition particle receptor subunit beta n=1 Tax=Trichomonascus vanleenenianus TaxID=2268995 RepID=UPI003ECBAAC8
MVDPKILFTALIGVIILVAVAIFISHGGAGSKKQAQPTFLIVGPSGSGKTSLFTKWTTGTVQDTVASTSANRFYNLRLPFSTGADETSFALIDLPGNPKLRYLTIDEVRKHKNLRGILFIVDGASGQAGVTNAASYLFDILRITEQRQGGVNILVAVNKSDVFNVLSAARVKAILEAQIGELRASRAKSLGEVTSNEDSTEDDGSWIGQEGQFAFEHLEGELIVLDGTVKSDRTHKWENWLEGHALND